MAICFNCGAIMQEEDMGNHKCKSENVPKKGEELKPTFTKVAI